MVADLDDRLEGGIVFILDKHFKPIPFCHHSMFGELPPSKIYSYNHVYIYTMMIGKEKKERKERKKEKEAQFS